MRYFDDLAARVTTEQGDWTVKGFIDIYQRVYTISLDTKVLSKVLELLILPVLIRFAEENNYQLILAQAQNQYPDFSLVSRDDETECIALDIKTTYRTGVDRKGHVRVNGMTLGTFGGYFRTRDRPLNSTFAYNRYTAHYVLGVVYSRVEDIDERQVYKIEDLNDIPSVIRDFQFFLHEKYRIASDRPGSGNTKNIGSTTFLERLVNGTGVFAPLGVAVFDDYWMNYRTRSMAQQEGFDAPPYTNLKTYYAYKKRGAEILNLAEDDIETEAGDLLADDEN
ncbi:MAG: restriction endonuclease [Chloroflexi bacterium]|nr:MAG: restriction endonuclease [Chloroflexota bacterium]